ncbi:hypothetical protein AVEN_212478-1 [Araneus ventricosus]|uniref:Uncharacterized protein n=1 Tax=Araneus ventricosus TaxID=182803 RepID=A0A4Y2TZ80_ARAVE|nr:hypothetical protein AVEN_212478-1 [Araneus ventricosus]
MLPVNQEAIRKRERRLFETMKKKKPLIVQAMEQRGQDKRKKQNKGSRLSDMAQRGQEREEPEETEEQNRRLAVMAQRGQERKNRRNRQTKNKPISDNGTTWPEKKNRRKQTRQRNSRLAVMGQHVGEEPKEQTNKEIADCPAMVQHAKENAVLNVIEGQNQHQIQNFLCENGTVLN